MLSTKCRCYRKGGTGNSGEGIMPGRNATKGVY